MSLSKAASYLASWIASKGRFDVDTLSGELGFDEDLEYLRAYVVEWLRDEDLLEELDLDRQIEAWQSAGSL